LAFGYADAQTPPIATDPRQTFAIIIYRWKLHPLAKYPGPWLAKVTDLYGVYQVVKARNHVSIYNAHQKYGEHGAPSSDSN
jgi:hypothetical protein